MVKVGEPPFVTPHVNKPGLFCAIVSYLSGRSPDLCNRTRNPATSPDVAAHYGDENADAASNAVDLLENLMRSTPPDETYMGRKVREGRDKGSIP